MPLTPKPQLEIRQFDTTSVGDVVATVASRWRSVLVTAAVCLPIFILGILLIPKKYDSQAQLLVRLGRGSLSVDLTSEVSKSVAIQESRISQVNSVRELLGSRAVLEAVVSKVGIDRVLEPFGVLPKLAANVTALLPERLPDGVGELGPQQVAEQIRFEEAIKTVQKALTISTEEDAYTVLLNMRTGSPLLSRDLLATLVDHYQDHHIQAFKNQGAEDFFTGQATEAFDRAVESQDKLNELKSKSKVADAGTALIALRNTINQVRGEHLRVESDLAAVEAEIEQLRTEMRSIPQQIDTEITRGKTKKLGDDMRQSLYGLEMQYQEMKAKLRPGNPKLIAVEEQIAEARKIAVNETGEQPETVEGVNSVYQKLEVAFCSAQVRRSGLVSKQTQLAEQLDTLEKELVAMNEADVRMTRANWEFELAEANYLQFARRLDEAKQIASLDKQRLSEISVTQNATLNLKRSTPKRAILAALACGLVAFLSLTQALLRGPVAVAELNNSDPANGARNDMLQGVKHTPDPQTPDPDSSARVDHPEPAVVDAPWREDRAGLFTENANGDDDRRLGTVEHQRLPR